VRVLRVARIRSYAPGNTPAAASSLYPWPSRSSPCLWWLSAAAVAATAARAHGAAQPAAAAEAHGTRRGAACAHEQRPAHAWTSDLGGECSLKINNLLKKVIAIIINCKVYSGTVACAGKRCRRGSVQARTDLPMVLEPSGPYGLTTHTYLKKTHIS
jgi:hypothetical protein